ncbi:Phosphoglycolate phosphatase [Acinetobacter bereziniae]|uniref:HAD family hydrolase n=1 Tax=Acinetobacter bereziniae TaxID=106648 RepID=UPI00057349AF|nr:HAD hydrolase-like protein [Acinetobacter bereziniae]CEI53776.1 Phosphoglycolate phosphatase [Acinetobacter bereziniae]
MKIVFDLDGTLICAKKRLYELFCDLIETKELTFDSYWKLKFLGNTNQDILRSKFQYSEREVAFFIKNWMDNIEQDKYLQMDTLIEGVEGLLDEISKSNELYICTARQSYTQVIKQLNNLGILGFFKEVFVTNQKNTKKELLINSELKFSKDDIFVGDTGHDIITGRELGMKTCAVLSGFMSKDKLELYSPDFIVKDATGLKI